MWRDWKTSVQPILTIFLVVAPLLTVDGSPVHSKYAAWSIGVASAVAKTWIGFLQKDAGTTLATVGGSAPQVVDSHEVPDNPQARPVK